MKIIERINPAQVPLWYHGYWYEDCRRSLVVTAIIPLNLILICLRNIWYFIKTFGYASDVFFYRLFIKLSRMKKKLYNSN